MPKNTEWQKQISTKRARRVSITAVKKKKKYMIHNVQLKILSLGDDIPTEIDVKQNIPHEWWDNLIQKYEVGSWPPPPFVTNFHIFPNIYIQKRCET